MDYTPMPSRDEVERLRAEVEGLRATLMATFEAACEMHEDPHPLMSFREALGYRLGTTAQAYLTLNASQAIQKMDRLEAEVERLRAELSEARAREAKWLQAFNSLEKPVTTHIERCIDADDLDRAHAAVMRRFGPNG